MIIWKSQTYNLAWKFYFSLFGPWWFPWSTRGGHKAASLTSRTHHLVAQQDSFFSCACCFDKLNIILQIYFGGKLAIRSQKLVQFSDYISKIVRIDLDGGSSSSAIANNSLMQFTGQNCQPRNPSSSFMYV